MKPRRVVAIVCTMSIVAAGFNLAGPYQEEDEQTRDHAQRDRRYLEQRRESANAATTDGDIATETEAYLARAEELVRDRNYRSAGTDRYRVQTDDPRINSAAVAALLERFRDFFEEYWSGRVELTPRHERSRVFLFYSFYKFNQLLEGDHRFSSTRPKGHYGSAYDVVTLHSDADEPGNVADALIHEAAHQLIDRQIYGGSAKPSSWVSEGLASYFGYMKLDGKGEFRPAEVGSKAATLFRNLKVRTATEARERLRTFRRDRKKASGEGSLVDRVISIDDPGRFYGPGVELHYSTAWVLVHYLLHGAEGRHAPAFLRYLELEVRGEGGADALYRELQLTPRQLDDALRAHVKKMA